MKIDINEFPAVKNFLKGFKPKIRQTGQTLTTQEIQMVINHGKKFNIEISGNSLKKSRKKTNNKWFETQDSIDYWEDFYKQKIVYNDITQRLSFAIAEDGMFFNNTVYFISGVPEELFYLITFLNSSIIDWYYKTLSVQLGERAVRLFSIYVENIPIIKKSSDNFYTRKIFSIIKNRNFIFEDNEEELENLIYTAYQLTKDEIRFIESQ